MTKDILPTNLTARKSNRPIEGGFFMKPARLYLQDGSIYQGFSPDWQTGTFSGEVVFNTGMTGYVESLTDPSYSGQILTFTFPLIGNYGVNIAQSESSKIQVSGVVVSEAASNYSHQKADISLLAWLQAQHVPLLAGVDTRSLTKRLRSSGTMIGAITSESQKPHLPSTVASSYDYHEPAIYNQQHRKRLILVDCGAKQNILRSLLAFSWSIKVVAADYDFTIEPYDAIFYSNGPGDPTDYQATIKIAKKALRIGKPVFGICLGSQILALAAGAKTYKLPFGHRGHNQPCMDASTKRCYITSQNHGFAVDESTLPKGWEVSFRNLNDNSVEGIRHKSKPFFAVQFHPEACPGPTDTAWLFRSMYQTL